jgi:hypothetical protein
LLYLPIDSRDVLAENAKGNELNSANAKDRYRYRREARHNEVGEITQ